MIPTTERRRVIYLHGFASSPQSNKARAFSRALRARGVDVTVPDLNEGNFRELTISRQLALLDRLTADSAAGSVLLIGSSLGGYTSAIFAARSETVVAAVLMAPAFDFARRWSARLGPTDVARWRSDGEASVTHYGTGKEELIGYGLMADGEGQPAYPVVSVPTLVVHGRQDETVDPEVSLRFARGLDNVVLEWVESDHSLASALDWIVGRSLEFLAPWLPRVSGT